MGVTVLSIASKRARNILFPSAPRALVSSRTGGVEKPRAGVLGSLDSLTGAPEKQKGEAIEEEASNFFNNFRHLAMRASGMHQGGEKEGDPLESKVPKPIRKGLKAIKEAGSPTDGASGEDSGQTEAPMEESIWSKARPERLWPVVESTPHAIGEIVDYWERLAKYMLLGKVSDSY